MPRSYLVEWTVRFQHVQYSFHQSNKLVSQNSIKFYEARGNPPALQIETVRLKVPKCDFVFIPLNHLDYDYIWYNKIGSSLTKRLMVNFNTNGLGN